MTKAWVTRILPNRREEVCEFGRVGDVQPRDRFRVKWRDPSGKLRQETIGLKGKPGKRLADERAEQLITQLTLGTYRSSTTWVEFRERFWRTEVSEKPTSTQRLYRDALDAFEEECSPALIADVTTDMLDDFRSKLRKRKGKRTEHMSPSTVNKHLRHIRRAVKKAAEWKLLDDTVHVQMMREPKKAPTFVPSDHFDLIYQQCSIATRPVSEAFTPEQWWQSLLATLLFTGCRIGELLKLRWRDVHLDDGYLLIRHDESKARRDDIVPLHHVAVDHLRAITDVGESVFEWPFPMDYLYNDFHAIQLEAGIELECRDHKPGQEHTVSCRLYGFHGLKRATGSLNAGALEPSVLGALMRHESEQTTRSYYLNRVHLAREALERMHVPKSLVEYQG